MKKYLMDLAFVIWESVMTCYTTPTTPLTNAYEKNPSENNSKDMSVILRGLSKSMFFKVGHCVSRI